MPVVVAVHSTALGPALGGAADLALPATADDGIRDALRLAAGMTLKAAAAELDLGGGKGVICAPAGGLEGERRRAALLDFGDLVESLDGRYITAEDVGTAPADLVAISERTEHVTGLPPARGGSGDPSPFTAIGVAAAIRACARERFGAGELAGLSVCVVGLGHVGAELARLLARRRLRADRLRHRPGQARAGRRASAPRWVEPGDAMPRSSCDVLAPVRARRRDRRRQRRPARLRGRLRLGQQPARRRLARRGAGRARDPLRARLHRQRRRPDPRLPRDQGLLGGARAWSSRAGSRRRLGRVLAAAAQRGDHPARRRARARRASGSARLCETEPDGSPAGRAPRPRPLRGGAADAGGARGGSRTPARSPTWCCCSSIRPSTRRAAARPPTSCRWARTGTGCRGSR